MVASEAAKQVHIEGGGLIDVRRNRMIYTLVCAGIGPETALDLISRIPKSTISLNTTTALNKGTLKNNIDFKPKIHIS